MKLFRIICLSLGLSMLTNLSPNLLAQGINFKEFSYAEALQEAAKDNKLVFIDFYTDWCAPCKKMSLEVFTKQSVGDIFNKNFINLTVDAEKGEGVDLAKKYKINAYPTMLWLNSKGEVLHKVLGAYGEEAFLAEAKILESSIQFGGLENMKKEFANNNNDPDFLLEFYNLFPGKDKMRPAIAIRYLNAAPDSVLFNQNDETIILRLGTMMEEINQFDSLFFYRFFNGVEKVQFSENKITPGYFMGVIFTAHQALGKLLEKAINSGNDKVFNQLVNYKEIWPPLFKNTQDSDNNLLYGRGLFFPSANFLRLEYLRVNELDQDFVDLFIPYMDNLVATYPKGELNTSNFNVDLLVERLKGVAQKEGNKRTSQIFSQSLVRHRARSIDYLTKFVEYYWRIAPSDKKTKKNISGWIDYIVSLNPYYSKGSLNSIPLVLKIGNKKLAEKSLENSINKLQEIGLGETANVKALQQKLIDVRKNKAY